MKRACTLALALILSLTLAACGVPTGSAADGAPTAALPQSADPASAAPSTAPPADDQGGSSAPATTAPATDADAASSAAISVYNSGGQLIGTVSSQQDLEALQGMLADAPVYSGAELHLSRAPYCLQVQGDSAASYDVWLRSGRIYFKAEGADTLYAPESMDISAFKQIINRP